MSIVVAVAPAHAQQVVGPIAVGSSATGNIERSGQQLWFRITLEAGVPYRFDLEGADTGKGTLPDPLLGLRGRLGGGLTSDNDSGEAKNARLFYRPAGTETHYLTVEAAPGSSVDVGTFTLSASIKDDFPDDSGTTVTIAIGESVDGEIEVPGDEDWFVVTLGTGLYRFDLEAAGTGAGVPPLPYPAIALYDSSGTRVGENAGGGVGDNARLFYPAAGIGTYYLAVVSSASGMSGRAAGIYTVSALLIPTVTLAVASSATGSIDASDDEDWFRITLEAGVRYWFQLEGVDTGKGTLPDPVLGLRNPDGNTLLARDDNGGMGNNALLFHVPSVAGIYYLVVAPAAGVTGTYTLSAGEAVAPTAHAGSDQTVSEGAVVTLDGAMSSPQNERLTYGWRQTSGTSVTLRDARARSTTFLAPTQLVNDEALAFVLVVTDVRGLSSPRERQLTGQTTNTVVITVRAGANDAPVANAGFDLIAGQGDVVALRGDALDPEGEEVTYRWRQTSGTDVVLTGATSKTATFPAPPVLETLGFELTVTDARGATGVDVVTVEVRDHVDYDVDNDTLIEVATTQQLAAIRHDLGGVGLAGVSGDTNRAAYLAAFPLFGAVLTCPNKSCTGYELSADLDLDGLDWTPLGGAATRFEDRFRDAYAAVFEGNGHVISNLRMTRLGQRRWSLGLFGVVSASGTIRNVGLRNVLVRLGDGSTYIGALVGRNEGKVAASYVSGGSISGPVSVGGLVGSNLGQVVASYADVQVQVSGISGGGLIGAGNAGSVVSASYSVGKATGSLSGGLIGGRVATAAVESSYFDAQRSGQSSCCGSNPPDPDNSSKTSLELYSPTTTADTIYAGWERLNVDDVDQEGDGDWNDDAPWDFGSTLDYPVLVFGGATETRPARRTLQQEAQEVNVAPTLVGSETVSEGATASYVVSLPVVLPAGVHARWDWSAGGGTATADDFVSTTGIVVIGPDAVSESFAVGVFDDDVPELSGFFVVTLSNARITGARARVSLGVPVSVRTTIEASDEMDYDADNDNLIEVATTQQLAAIRHDLGGAGLAGVSGDANEAEYLAAFPLYGETETCPGTCRGYELSADLDLDGLNWKPLGGGVLRADYPGDAYTAVFEGNGHVISNLQVVRGREWQTGLFGFVRGGTIRNVGLRNAQVDGSTFVGALVGDNEGEVAASYVIGGRISGGTGVGGLIGGLYEGSTLVASYAAVAVHANVNIAGGLVGEIGAGSVVSASYSVGLTTGRDSGGLTGSKHDDAVVESSYFDEERSRRPLCCGLGRLSPDNTPQASGDLRAPTTAADIYTGWNGLNVDRVDQERDGNLNDDAPWDFGSVFEYPVLVFGGATETRSARRASQRAAQPKVDLTPTLAGSETVSEGGAASYVVRLSAALPAGARVSWDWSVGGEIDADDVVGTTGSVVIGPGAVSASFVVRVFDDAVAESYEFMMVGLSNARLTGAPERGVILGVPAPVMTIIALSDVVETDYDVDDDTLIEVATTQQLAAIGYDLGGAGLAGVSGDANRIAYLRAFPFFGATQTCPGNSCTGYELSADLDLSGIAEWTPIGGGGQTLLADQYYTAVFEGNGHVISNLQMNGSESRFGMGLFGAVGVGGTIRNVGLRNARVNVAGSFFVGALVGRLGELDQSNRGRVVASYVSGGRISGEVRVGGLIGANYGTVVASYADVEVHADVEVGGLIGRVGDASVVSASYSIGRTTGGARVGGLIGHRDASAEGGLFGFLFRKIGTVESSYFDEERSGQSSCCGTRSEDLDDSVAKASSELLLPTTAAGTIYAGWDQLNVDGVDQENDGDFNDDAPWDFGGAFDYPVLVFGGSTETRRARRTSQQEAQPETIILTPLFAGSMTVSEGETASYVVSLPVGWPAEVSASWVWTVGGDEVVAADFIGTSGRVVIASGASSASFSVGVRDDVALELSEVMVVGLSDARLTGAPAHVSLGVPASVMTTIFPSDGVGRDYDVDGDTLIEVATTQQLAAIRHDLSGAGLAGVLDIVAQGEYLTAFPFFDVAQTCPNESCTGYELSTDLDLSGVNWNPIGGGGRVSVTRPATIGLVRVLPEAHRYNAVFEGNGHVISNMNVSAPDTWHFVGLFRAVSSNGVIRNVGLTNVTVDVGVGSIQAGALVGAIYGDTVRVAASYATGSVKTGWGAGGLVGDNHGTVIASYADVSVEAKHRDGAAGGLVGILRGSGVVSASYSVGLVTGINSAGGLTGNRAGEITGSYFDRERSEQSSCCGAGTLPVPDETPQDSADLRALTAAEDIYVGWNMLDVDGVDQEGDNDYNDDAPWHFGSEFDYPVLVFAGSSDTEQARRALQQEAQGVSLAVTITGSETVSEGEVASYVVSLAGELPARGLPAGVSASWNWAVGGDEVDAGDFAGATTGSVIIPSGAVSASFSVTVFDDAVPELSEVIVVTLSNARFAGAPAHVGLGVPASVRTTIEASDEIDYDTDDDTLIDVATTQQLAAIRYDLGGVGLAGVSSANEAEYLAAFFLFDEEQTCPSACTGYELSADLDLSGVDWTPLGGGVRLEDFPGDYYTVVFEGNGHVISNLQVIRDGRWHHVGLFGAVSASATIRNVGLRNARVILGSGSEIAGALVGHNEGKVAASYVSGGRISGGYSVGGLIGINDGDVVASYADVEVHAEEANAGGLVGRSRSSARIIASYSVGETTGRRRVGGLIGNKSVATVVESSYFDKERSGQDSCCGNNRPSPDNAPKTSGELLFPTTATGTIYAGWDSLNVDDTSSTVMGVLTLNDDAPWDFGTVFDYPVLVFGGSTDTEQARRTLQQEARSQASLTPAFAGSALVAEGGTASYVVSLPGALPAGVSASWNWAVGGGEVDAGDFVGVTAGSVVIAPGAGSASFSLRARDDGVPETPDEVLLVTLSNARLTGAPARVALGVPSAAARTTIADNEQITVAAEDATVSENTTATFTITLSGGGDQAVVVEYEITAVSEGLTHEDLSDVNVTGRAGASVRSVVALPFTGSVVLNEMGMATIGVGVANDQVQDEGRERFRLRLTGCPNCITEYPAKLGTPSFADVGIRRGRTSVVVDARVYLQGALLPGSRLMRTDLASLLPNRQPYGALSWDYPVTTTVPHAGTAAGLAGVTSTVVDWVLVELRTGVGVTAAASSQPMMDTRAAGLLLSDGRIVGINAAAAALTDALSLDGVRFNAELPADEDVYVLIHHRNHLSVMSAAPVAETTGDDCGVDYCVDFRVVQSHADGQVEVAPGMHAMVAGDLDQSGVIDERDEVLIRVYNLTSLGAAGYRDPDAAGSYEVDADLDFDGEVLSADRHFVIENKGRRRAFSIQ